MEVERSLRSSGVRRVEFELRNGGVVDTVIEQDVSTNESTDAVISRAMFQKVTVTRYGGNTTRVTARVHRQHK